MLTNPERFEALTFDCYGTLIDWEGGILGALRPLVARHRVEADDDELLAVYAGLEAAAEAAPYRPYREVLAEVVRGFGARYGFSPSAGEIGSLAASIRDWEPFPDTVVALERLACRHRLVVVSNVDRDLFAASRAKLGPAIADVVTAEDARAYKPARAVFEHALAYIDLPRDRVLHVAQSLYHDIAVAHELGLATVWIDRRQGRSGGATPAATASADLAVPTLAALADALGL